MTLTVSDDAGDDEVDVTIASSGGGGSPGTGSSVSTTGLQCYYKAAATVTAEKRVSAIDDDPAAAAGLQLAQATARRQPYYIPADPIANNQPGVMFDGLSFLNNTTAAPVTVTDDFAFATVLKWIWNQGGAQPVLWHNGVPSTNGMGLAANFTGASVWLVRTLHQFVDFGNYDVAYPMHIPVVLYWEKVGGVTTMYVNGLACPRASGSETIIAPGNGFWIGANGTNDVAAFIWYETLGYTSAPSSGDRATIIGELMTAYGLG